MRRLLRSRPVIAGVAALSVFVAGLAASLAGLMQPLELLAYDMALTRLAVRDTPSAPVTLVGATEADIAEYGWPLPDGVLARLITTIRGQAPRAIGIDIYRDKPVPPGTDALDAVLAAPGNLVWVYKFSSASGPRIPPPAALEGGENTGFADIVIDGDGRVRRGLLFLDDENGFGQSMALALAGRHLAAAGILSEADPDNPDWMRLGTVGFRPVEADDGGYVGADAGGYQFMADFRGGDAPFTMSSVADVLRGDVPAGRFRDSVVIVGTAAESVKDYFATPFDHVGGDGRAMLGIVLHAHLTAQLLRHGLAGTAPIRPLGNGFELAWLLLCCALGGALAAALRRPAGLVVVLALGLGAIGAVGYGALGAGWWLPSVAPMLGWPLAAGLATAWLSHLERVERAALMGIFSRHVSAEVAAELWRQREDFLEGGRPKAREITATVLFSDIAGFTPISEGLSPPELMDWLNEYLAEMARIVIAHGGVVDKFIGDAVMAVFGAPLPSTTPEQQRVDARAAIACAEAMVVRLDALNQAWRAAGQPEIGMRVGLHTGPVVAGSLGGDQRMDYTVIGDTVNVAARLESFGKEVAEAGEGCTILASRETLDLVGGIDSATAVGEIVLKGKSAGIEVYRLPTG